MSPLPKLSLIDTFIKKLEASKNKIFNIEVGNKKEEHIHFHIGNMSKASPKDLKELYASRENLKELITADKFKIVANTTTDKLEDVKKFSNANSGKDSYTFVVEHIPKEDKFIWLSALMLKQANIENDRDKVRSIKEQMIIDHKQKGRNIANICSAGYLEEYIIPWYSHYVEEKDDYPSFISNYKSIVDNLSFVIFIGAGKSVEEIKLEIENKIEILVNAHIEYLFIHALGEPNIEKAEKVLEGLSDIIPEITDINKTTTRFNLKAEISLPKSYTQVYPE